MDTLEQRPVALRHLQRPSHRRTRAAIRHQYERRISAETAIWATKIAQAIGLDQHLATAAGRTARAIATRATRDSFWFDSARAPQTIVGDICRVAHRFAVALDPLEGAPETPNNALRSIHERESAAGDPRLVAALGSHFRLYRPMAVGPDPRPCQQSAC